MNYYISATILIELMMIAMTLHVLNYPGLNNREKFWYLCTFISIMLCAGAEFAVHCGYYDPRYAQILTFINYLQFSIAPLLSIMFSGALGKKRQDWLVIISTSLSFLIELIFLPSGKIFYFNEHGYFRGEYFIIYEITFFISLLYLIFNMISVGKRFRHRDNRTIMMIIIILIAGILPMVILRVNITYVAIGISSSLCYIYYNDLIQQDIQSELVLNQKRISQMQSHVIYSLANLIENRDIETGEHVARTSNFAGKLAEDARAEGVYADIIDDQFIRSMRILAPLHDIGKITVSDKILRKPGKLNKEEYDEMKKHAAAGERIIRDVLKGLTEEEHINFAADIAKYHHERWDGTGYPEGLKGEQIPLSARIMALADVYDALVSKRIYKDPIPSDKAVRIIIESSGSHFDPKLVEVFLKDLEDFTDLYNETDNN